MPACIKMSASDNKDTIELKLLAESVYLKEEARILILEMATLIIILYPLNETFHGVVSKCHTCYSK